MTTDTFASDLEREGDWLILPRDIEWRRQLFGPNVMEHPAKMQLFIPKLVMEHYGREGMRVLDPFAGTGTTALAATMGFATTLIELEDRFMDLLKSVRRKWRDEGLIDSISQVTIMQGDCRRVLPEITPESHDIIITSPPYSVTAQVGEVVDNGDGTATSKDGTVFTGIVAKRRLQMYNYGSGGADSRNIGRLNPFMFNQAQLDVFKKAYKVLKPDGLYVSVTKDNMKEGVRIKLADDIVKMAKQAGFKVKDWHKWKAPGSMFQMVAKTEGKEVVEDEDIIVLEKA